MSDMTTKGMDRFGALRVAQNLDHSHIALLRRMHEDRDVHRYTLSYEEQTMVRDLERQLLVAPTGQVTSELHITEAGKAVLGAVDELKRAFRNAEREAYEKLPEPPTAPAQKTEKKTQK